MKSKFGPITLLLTLALLCGRPGIGPSASGPEVPRLVLMIVVDQLRPDYLVRFGDRFEGGLKRLRERGASFSKARHGHAITTTGPGHASLATGVHPARHGVIDNAWYDRKAGAVVNCVEDESAALLEAAGPGRSPRNLLADGLADWIERADPESKVFSASRKDRGAILPAGRNADAAYWYDSTRGRFITSDRYLASYPEWVRVFDARDIPGGYFGRQWSALPGGVDPARDRAEGVGDLDEGAFSRRLPVTLGSATLAPDADFYSDFGSCPFMDDYLESFAEALVVGESLGLDDHPDFLALSFSSLDSVGHEYGPNSPQVRDAVLRLDLALGRLFGFLDDRVGEGRWLAALSSDHGVAMVPEFGDRGGGARRFNEDDRLCFQRAGLRLRAQLGDEDWFLRGLYLDYEAVGRRNLRRSEVEDAAAALLTECDAVARVWTRTELESEAAVGGFGRQYRRSFHPARSPDLMVQLRESVISVGGRGTTHGSPYDYDTRVPLVIMGPGAAPGEIEVPVETVDLAPTLAELLGLSAPPDLDGVSRVPLLKRREGVAH